MGFYIEKIGEEWLPPKGKAQFLVEKVPGAQLINGEPKSWMPDLVCIVMNPLFDAAGYAYSEAEFKRFIPRSHDYRPRQWLRVPGAQELSHFDPELAEK